MRIKRPLVIGRDPAITLALLRAIREKASHQSKHEHPATNASEERTRHRP
jgi:hypothetical protein